MQHDEAVSRLRRCEADLQWLGVEHFYLFGLTARGISAPSLQGKESFHARHLLCLRATA